MQRLRLGQILALLGEDKIEQIIHSDHKSFTFYCSIKALIDKTKRIDPMHLGEEAHRAVIEEMNAFEHYLRDQHGLAFAYEALIQPEKLPLPIVDETFEEAIVVPPVS